MTIKIEKEYKANGEIWYNIYQDSVCVKCYEQTEESPNAGELAKEYYLRLVQSVKGGLPKIEVIDQFNTEE